MTTDFAARMVDALNDLHGLHPGTRAIHAKGMCCSATFTATPSAASMTRAAHMQGDAVPATVRFSNGSGSPTRHDGARDGRGMATKFHLPGGGTTDIVALTLPVFFVRTPDDFLAFTRAQKPDPDTGKPDLGRIEEFVAAHPETQLALGFSMFTSPPASYAQCRYFGIHAFKWINADGDEQFVRDQQAGCEALIFDPTRVTEGIECSADEILHARPVAYSVSYERRTAARR